jgi:hypothetical protein
VPENNQDEKEESTNTEKAFIVPPVVTDNAQENKEESSSTSEQVSEEKTTLASSTPDHHRSEGATTTLQHDASTKDTTKCRWGEHCPDTITPHPKHDNDSAQHHKHDNDNHTDHLPPFVTHSTNPTKTPPEGFILTSRVYTDPTDKLAHFDSAQKVSLEYWECGVVGSTTSPLNVKHAYFRHALPRAAPTLWSGTEYGTHPQLLIPLKPLELLLNSGEEQAFQPGDVILLEDVIQGGHKIRSQDGDLSALLLTLPQHVSLNSSRRAVFCQTPSSRSRMLPQIRKALFGGIGLGLSSLGAVFLGKVAPLWLSVGVGGLCFITGGTYAAVTCGEYAWQEVELALERQRLKGEEQVEGEQGEEEEEDGP